MVRWLLHWLPIYWRVYLGRMLSILAALFSFVFLGAWLFRDFKHGDGSWDTLGAIAHPAILIIAAGVAVFTGVRFSRNLRAIRFYIPGEPLETLEDRGVEPWRAINHSFSKIEWTPIIEQRLLDAVKNFCIEQCKFRWLASVQFCYATYILEQLLEETGTINFRLLRMFGTTKFIRIHKEPKKDDLICRDIVSRHLRTNEVFDSRVSKVLVPLSIRHSSKSHSFDVSDNLACYPAGDFTDYRVGVHIFPYCSADRHFSGRTIEEITVVADKLGYIQETLKTLPTEDKEIIKYYQRNRKSAAKDLDAEKIQKKWEGILEYVANNKNNHMHKCKWILEYFEKGLITQMDKCLELKKKLKSEKDGYPILLHDVHPHNVLIEVNPINNEHKSILIYDYQWIGQWNHAAVTAFAIHRFVREYVRYKNKSLCSSDTEEERERLKSIREGVRAFLHSYINGCALRLPENFLQDMGAYIFFANVEKLINILEKVLGIKPDELNRSTERLDGEARKFIRFAKESNQFTKAFVNHGQSVDSFLHGNKKWLFGRICG